eukprot:g8464.t1
MDGTPPAVFCGDAWRIFDWELESEAQPLPTSMNYGNSYTDYNVILNDEEFWNGGEFRQTNNNFVSMPPVTNTLFQPPCSSSELDLQFSQRKRERRILPKTARVDFIETTNSNSSSRGYFAPSNGLSMMSAPFMNAQFADRSNGLSLDCTKNPREQTMVLLQSTRDGSAPLHAMCEPLVSTGLVYAPDLNHQGRDSFQGLCEPRAKKTKTNATSQYKGVTKHRQTGKFEAHLWDATVIRRGKERRGRKRGKQIYLGGFTSELAAARTYDMAAICFWGNAAVTNFPVEDYAADWEFLKSTDKHSIVKILRRSAGGYRNNSKIFSGLVLGGFVDGKEVS